MTDDSTRRPYAVVTGAASGVGREVAHQFSVHGYDVLLVDDDDDVLRAPAELGGCGRGEARQVDRCDFDAVQGLWEQITAAGRPVDAIALVTGGGPGRPFVESDVLDEIDTIELDVSSTVHLTKRALQMMVVRGEGCVLFTSVISPTADPCHATSAAAAAFVQTFAAAVRAEVASRGVTVATLVPGPADDPAAVARKGVDALLARTGHLVGGVATGR